MSHPLDDYTLSIVIPAYNEVHCIADALTEVFRSAGGCPALREVIVVDDGSTDGTAEVVEELRRQHAPRPVALTLLRNPRNQGKGASVRHGLLHATGDIVLFTDADLSTPMTEAPRLVQPIAAGECDIVIGSRAIDRSLIAIHQSRLRETAGKLFNVIVRGVTGLPIRDTQCGFKAFRRQAVLPVFQVQRTVRFAFDVEVLYLAAKLGLRIRELPVRWSHVAHTKVSLPRDSVQMFSDVIGIRVNDLCGRYKLNGCPGGPR